MMAPDTAGAVGDIFVMLLSSFTFGAIIGHVFSKRDKTALSLQRYVSKPFKEVSKPWGKEVWLELNGRYCYKRIYIKAGTRTSYQYHNQKSETNYIIEGTAEVWLENDNGVVEKFVMHEGDFFNVPPPKKHRVIAITDIILQEVSTPEVDDVIRIQDDAGRPDGKIEAEHCSR